MHARGDSTPSKSVMSSTDRKGSEAFFFHLRHGLEEGKVVAVHFPDDTDKDQGKKSYRERFQRALINRSADIQVANKMGRLCLIPGASMVIGMVVMHTVHSTTGSITGGVLVGFGVGGLSLLLTMRENRIGALENSFDAFKDHHKGGTCSVEFKKFNNQKVTITMSKEDGDLGCDFDVRMSGD